MQHKKNANLSFHPATPKGWQGNPFEGKEFKYVRDTFRPDWKMLLKMLFSANPQRQEKKADKWTPTVSTEVAYLDDRKKDWVVWLGHACFLIQLNGIRFLIDPQLADMPFVPRRAYPPFGYEDIRGVDYLLLSHDHRDHIDKKCVRAICANNNIRKVLCPLKLSRTIGKWVGETVIEEAGWYQQFNLPGTGVDITFLPSRHWCRRGLTDFNRSLWGSFMIEQTNDGTTEGKVTRHTIYFGGDSAKTSYWSDVGTMFPNIDIAMLGIGAYAPAYMMEENHANPEEAFQGYLDLKAKYWWPMHHGTYDLSNEPAGEPMRRATKAMMQADMMDRLIPATINAPHYFESRV